MGSGNDELLEEFASAERRQERDAKCHMRRLRGSERPVQRHHRSSSVRPR
jgi:hypothetical protein